MKHRISVWMGLQYICGREKKAYTYSEALSLRIAAKSTGWSVRVSTIPTGLKRSLIFITLNIKHTLKHWKYIKNYLRAPYFMGFSRSSKHNWIVILRAHVDNFVRRSRLARPDSFDTALSEKPRSSKIDVIN